jgi:hypothetical protein
MCHDESSKYIWHNFDIFHVHLISTIVWRDASMKKQEISYGKFHMTIHDGFKRPNRAFGHESKCQVEHDYGYGI